MGSGGACSPPVWSWSCRLKRPGLGFIVGGLLNRLFEVCFVVPLVGCSSAVFFLASCLLNLFTMLLTFPPESLKVLPLSPKGGEPGWCDGFGGISGLSLHSDLTDDGDVGR